MIRFFRGYERVKLTGAAPLQALNRFSDAGIAFWNVEPCSELQIRCFLYRKDLPKAERAALRAMCTLEREREYGLHAVFAGLKRRPVLVLGTILAVLLAVLAQNIVWLIRIEGNTTVSEAEIRHALEEEGIQFGCWGPDLSSQMVRHRMQLRLPKLGWLAANRSGGVLTVLVSERDEPVEHVDWQGAANVIAARPGIITSVSALNGTAAVAPGDAVGADELLISGITTWENRTQVTHAAGEVYALTDRLMQIKTPDSYLEKHYTGRTAREYYLIVGRKRRKIFGNSRISAAECDKMISRRVCTLPGAFTLPLTLETVEYRFYETSPAQTGQSLARQITETFAERYTNRAMIAGTILHTDGTLTKEKGCYVWQTELSCEEMISVTVPIRNILEDDTFGKTDQRGAD